MAVPKQDLIDEVMDNFDFERVHEVMTALDWTWAPIGDVPEKFELRKCARDLLKGALETGLHGTGGLMATFHDGTLDLSFQITSWEAYVDDKGNVVSG